MEKYHQKAKPLFIFSPKNNELREVSETGIDLDIRKFSHVSLVLSVLQLTILKNGTQKKRYMIRGVITAF